jgi:hypothetical protein
MDIPSRGTPESSGDTEMTPAHLAEIEARHAAATEGPYRWRGKSGSLHGPGAPPYEFGKTVLSPTWEYDSGVDIEVSEVDAAFIAASWQDISDLLALAKEQAAENEQLKAQLSERAGSFKGHHRL